jgi:hypothetical protein
MCGGDSDYSQKDKDAAVLFYSLITFALEQT